MTNARDRIYPVTDSECDRCHATPGFGGALYAVEGDQEGSWAYCGHCALVVADQLERSCIEDVWSEAHHW